MDASLRRKITIIALVTGAVAVILFAGYAFLWRSQSKGLPSSPPPLPAVPANPPSNQGTPPPVPSMPL